MSKTNDDEFLAFDELEKQLKDFSENISEEKVLHVMKKGADEFVNILLKLPKPRSNIRSAGYTHLVNTFSSRINKGQVEVGWGKYYGPMVERGTKKMSARPHMIPTWKQNREKIYKTMVNDLGLQKG